MKKDKGITLIVLIVSIIILIILASIGINFILGNNGLIIRSQRSREEYKISQAREKLIVALEGAQIEKVVNKKYDQDDFLDEFILNELKDAKIYGDIVIVDGYAFGIDRSVPKIGKDWGKEDDLVLPELTISIPELAYNHKTATFSITAKEKENGISKVEVWQEESKKEEFDFNNEKEKTITYTATRNGKYYIKAYANKTEITITKKIAIDGLVVGMKFEPDGNEVYKKEHSTKVIIEETEEKVKSMKYQWANTAEEPKEESYKLECNDNQEITKNNVTGTYYAWVLVEFESGKKKMYRSEGFNFDNEGPDITGLETVKYSGDGITLNVTAKDAKSPIEKLDIYIDGEFKDTKNILDSTLTAIETITITGLSMGEHQCTVIATDINGNPSKDRTVKR